MFTHTGLVHDVSALELLTDEHDECTHLLAGRSQAGGLRA